MLQRGASALIRWLSFTGRSHTSLHLALDLEDCNSADVDPDRVRPGSSCILHISIVHFSPCENGNDLKLHVGGTHGVIVNGIGHIYIGSAGMLALFLYTTPFNYRRINHLHRDTLLPPAVQD